MMSTTSVILNVPCKLNGSGSHCRSSENWFASWDVVVWQSWLRVVGTLGTLLNHVHSTSRAFEGIKDEIKSIKSLRKVRSDAVESKVEEINDSTITLKNELSNVSFSVNKKKLQSISDRLRQTKPSKDTQNNRSCTMNSNSTSFPEKRKEIAQNKITPDRNTSSETSTKSRFENKSNPASQRVLLIGSSILQRVNKRDLTQNMDVMTNRGAIVQHIKRKLEQIGISRYRAIIVQAGGNDLSEGRNEEAVENDFVDLINYMYIQTESHQTSTYISEITPRRDADVTDMNNYIR